jgi:spermidine/putrescine transport system permease protein
MRRRSPWLWAAAIVAYAFLYVPLLIVVVYSFNDSRLNAEWVGFTLDWYRTLAHDEQMLRAAGNSLVIGIVASGVSTVLGTMAGLAMHRYRLRLLPILIFAPIAIPEILTGVSCRSHWHTSRSASASWPSSCVRASPAWTRR